MSMLSGEQLPLTSFFLPSTRSKENRTPRSIGKKRKRVIDPAGERPPRVGKDEDTAIFQGVRKRPSRGNDNQPSENSSAQPTRMAPGVLRSPQCVRRSVPDKTTKHYLLSPSEAPPAITRTPARTHSKAGSLSRDLDVSMPKRRAATALPTPGASEPRPRCGRLSRFECAILSAPVSVSEAKLGSGSPSSPITVSSSPGDRNGAKHFIATDNPGPRHEPPTENSPNFSRVRGVGGGTRRAVIKLQAPIMRGGTSGITPPLALSPISLPRPNHPPVSRGPPAKLPALPLPQPKVSSRPNSAAQLLPKALPRTRSPVRFVPSSQSQYLYLSPSRPRPPQSDTAGDTTDEVVDSSQSQKELELCIQDEQLGSKVELGIEVCDNSVTARARHASQRHGSLKQASLTCPSRSQDSNTLQTLSCPNTPQPVTCRLDQSVTSPPRSTTHSPLFDSLERTSPLSIPSTQGSTVMHDADEAWSTLPTQFRLFEEMFDEDEITREGHDRAPTTHPRRSRDAESDGSVTESESDGEFLVPVGTTLAEAVLPRNDNPTHTETSIDDTPLPQSSLWKKIPAFVGHMAEPSLYGSDDYQCAGAALSIPSESSSLELDAAGTSASETLPDAVKAFADMFEDDFEQADTTARQA